MEAQLFQPDTVPEWTTPGWYAERETAPHLEQDGHRDRLRIAAEFINEMRPASVSDMGAGDGGLLTLVDVPVKWGYDLQQTNVEAAARRGVNVMLADVVADQAAVTWGECVVMTEMLEHLVDPHGFVKTAHDLGVKYLVASSPYTETAHSHYEFHTWAWDLDGYRAMLENAGWRMIRTSKAWICQVVLAIR